MDTCIICCLGYNVKTRRPFDLGCGHCICEACFKCSKLSVCVECRQPANNPHLQYTLLRMLQPSSPTSFPIPATGLVDDAADDAPGTPPPSAPIMEVEPWESDDSELLSRRSTSSSLQHTVSLHSGTIVQSSRLCHSSSGGSSSNSTINSNSLHHNLSGQQLSSLSSNSNSSSILNITQQGRRRIPVDSAYAETATASSGRHIPHRFKKGTNRSSSRSPVPQQLLQHIPAAAPEESCNGFAAAEELFTSVRSRCDSSDLQQQLASFPVAGLLDWLEHQPESPDSNSGSRRQSEFSDGGEGDQLNRSRSQYVNATAVNAVTSGGWSLLQQLLVPHALIDKSAGHGWPHPGPSLLLAVQHSYKHSTAAYTAALHDTGRQCRLVQQQFVDWLDRALGNIGLANSGHIASYVLATWLLGFLLFHWHLGLQLLPIGVSSGGLYACSIMASSSGSNSSSSSSLGPARVAGGLLAVYGLTVSMLLGIGQWFAVGVSLQQQLLAAAPLVLLLAALLLWGQVATEVVNIGWSSYAQLRFASLVVRSWCVAAAAVVCGGSGAGAAAAAAFVAVAWVQKCSMLLEAPVMVHQLGMILKSAGDVLHPHCAYGALRQHDSTGMGNSSSHSDYSSPSSRGLRHRHALQHSDSCHMDAAPSSGGSHTRHALQGHSSSSTANGSSDDAAAGTSAWLLCMQGLLQLLLLLYVPPAPLAAVAWLPLLLRNALAWCVRVVACGCLVQFLPFLSHNTDSSNFSSSAVGRGSDGNAHYSNAGSSSWMQGHARELLEGCSSSGNWESWPSPLKGKGKSQLRSAALQTVGPTAGGGADTISRGSSPVQGIKGSREAATDSHFELHACLNKSQMVSATAAAAGHAQLGYSNSSRVYSSRQATVVQSMVALLKQHIVYSVLLLLAVAGDSFVMAVPSNASAGIADVRVAWHKCIEQLLLLALISDVAAAVWHEVQLFRYHHVLLVRS